MWRPHLLLPSMILMLGSCSLNTQPSRFGMEIQAYPAGIIPGIQVQRDWHEDDVLITRFAANITNRSDFGEHDHEEGDGFGFGLGYRKYEHNNHSGWLYGVRADFWNLTIDWKDNVGPRSGSTDVFVFQPAVEGGYSWLLDEDTWSLDLSAGLGAEINLSENGEPVGDGAIVLLGITFLYNG